MSFLYLKKIKHKQMTPYKFWYNPPSTKRAFSTASHLKASLTLEATITLPLFIAGIIAFIFLIQAVQVQMRIEKALFNQTMKISGYAFYIDGVGVPDQVGNFVETSIIKKAVIDEVGEEFLDNSYIVGGKDGISVNFMKEYREGILDVELVYKMEVPYNLFGIKPVTYTTRAVCHTWIGGKSDDLLDETEYAYVTPNATVYHSYSDCTYLVMPVSTASYSELDKKYKACSSCCEENIIYTNVYYTQYGERYHSTVLCSNLHRNVFMIELDKAAKQYELCSRCSKRK